MIEKAKQADVAAAAVGAALQTRVQRALIDGNWNVVCHRPAKSGRLIKVWDRTIANLVTTQGMNELLTQALKGSGYTAAWYAGIVDSAGFSAYAEADTLASHAGWAEFTDYTGNRKAITFGTASAGSLASSSIPTFTISGATGTENIAGLMVANAATGTSGVLLSAGAFTGGNAPVQNGYVVTATYTLALDNA